MFAWTTTRDIAPKTVPCIGARVFDTGATVIAQEAIATLVGEVEAEVMSASRAWNLYLVGESGAAIRGR